MTRQIAVRLPDELVDFIDDLVGNGQASSRAGVVTRALERERRRQMAVRDVAILTASEPDIEFAALAEFAAATSLDDLD